MRRSFSSLAVCLLTHGMCTLIPLLPAYAQQVEWHHCGADRSHSRYLPLDQVNKSNVKDLKEVWRWKSVAAPIAARNRRLRPGPFKPTPLMVSGGFLRAWDKTNGNLVWERTIGSRPLSTPMTYMPL